MAIGDFLTNNSIFGDSWRVETHRDLLTRNLILSSGPPPMQGSTTNNSKFTEINMHNMLQVRMGWNVSAPQCKFKKVSPHKLNDEKAVVFVIHGEKALLIEDDLHLYPSDALVTQLRLLEDSK